jgi:hypothetical protein
MPRFFFNVHDGAGHPDCDGTELPDIPAARAYAVRYFGDLLRGDPCAFWNGEEWKMEVTDESGLLLFSLHFHGVDAPAVAQHGPTILI